MNKRSRIQGYLLKLGFILYISLHQSLTFAYPVPDINRLPVRNKVELVGKPKPHFKSNTPDYFSFKQYLSDQFSLATEILAYRSYCSGFVKIYNQEIKVSFIYRSKLFDNEISPILNKDISRNFFHLFKTEMLICSV